MYEPYEPHSMSQSYQPGISEVTEPEIAAYLAKVMGWMCVGLVTTLASAMLCLVFVDPMAIVNSFTLIMIVQLGVAFGLGLLLNRISPAAATALFLLYSAIMGVTLSTFYYIFYLDSIVTVFGMAAVLFFAMAMYGLLTRRDLSRIGAIAFMGLIAVILAGVVNIFFYNETMNYVITVVGLLVFVALTAYDVQKIKSAYVSIRSTGNEYGSEIEIEEQTQKLAIYGAFQLYLDFINIFIRLLILFGRRR